MLSLNTSQAQQEIDKLEKASSELKSENKDLRKSMDDLTASAKRNSEEYRNLEAQYKKNNRAIAENNAKTQLLHNQQFVLVTHTNMFYTICNDDYKIGRT